MGKRRVVVITGVSNGIGRALVRALDSSSNLVIGISRNQKLLDSLRTELKSPTTCELLQGDISDHNDVERLTKTISTITTRVDSLIHNAGSLLKKPLSSIMPEDLMGVYSTNVFGPALLSSRLFPLLKRSPSETASHVVHIASMGGVQGSQKFPGLAIYSSSKAALIGLAECMAEEWRNEGIRSNVLAIGSVSTEMFREAFPGIQAAVSPDKMADYIAEFALNGHELFNGKVLQVSNSTP